MTAMTSLFDDACRRDLVDRIARLSPAAPRLWGTMTPTQALAHLEAGLAVATGEKTTKRMLAGRLLSWIARPVALGAAPFRRNLPTSPLLVVADAADFEAERTKLLGTVDRFVALGVDGVARREHVFFGKLSGEEWGVLMAKHLDHHLRQFGG